MQTTRTGSVLSLRRFFPPSKLENKTGEHLKNISSKARKHHDVKIKKDMIIKMLCDYCKGSMHNKPHILKFGSFERFFCCSSCREVYKEK
jgi:Lrp/AsnC family leucine-responsive transcriptional regulator